METCKICHKQFTTKGLTKHQWRCFQTSLDTTAATDVMDRAILAADLDTDMAIETPNSPNLACDDEMDDSLEDGSGSNSGHQGDWNTTNKSVAFTFHPDVDRNTLAPDNDSTDDEDGARSDDDQMFDYVSLVNHIGEQDLDPPWSFTADPAAPAGRPPSAATLMDLFEVDESGETSTMKCQLATEGYLKIGQPEDYSMFELIRVLDSHRCPRKMVGEIINWCRLSQLEGVTNMGALPKERATFTKKIEKSMINAGVQTTRPSVQWVQLESTPECGRQTVPVITWDFEQQLRSLLSDMTLFSDLNNLVVNPHNPFFPIPDTMPELVGTWYTGTAKERAINGRDGRFLLGATFGQDRAHTTENGRWSIEPVLVSCDILTPEVRERPNAWRIIALIPVIDEKSSAQVRIAKNRVASHSASIKNYHACLKAAYASVVKLHARATISNDGGIPNHSNDYHFTADLTLGEYMRPMDIVAPCSNIVTDGEGADKAAARNCIKQGEAGRISRGCLCIPVDSDNAQLRCEDLSKEDVMSDYYQLVQNNLRDTTDSTKRRDTFVATHQVHPVENALWFLDFGVTKNGPYKALRIDPMHAGELGIIPYLVKLLSGGEDARSNSLHKMNLDLLALKHFKDAPRTSARLHFPRTCFSGGITSFAYMPAHEWPGVLLTITLLGTMGSTRNEVLGLGLPNPTMQDDKLFCLELMLCFHAWVSYGPFTELYNEASYTKTDQCVRDLASLLVTTCARQEGWGWKLQKFHDLFVHLISDIRDMKSGYALHMGLVERMHKFFAKIPACTAQKRGQFKYLSQVASRLQEQQMLNQARYMYQADVIPQQEKDTKKGHSMRRASARVLVKKGNTNHDPVYLWLGSNGPQHGIHPLITNSVRTLLGAGDDPSNGYLASDFLIRQSNGALVTNLYTEANLDGRLFRCHPDHQKEGPWYDWVMVTWEIDDDDRKYDHCQSAPAFWSPPLIARKKKTPQNPPTLSELVFDISNHIPNGPRPDPTHDESRVIFVPARILCFLKNGATGTPWAVIHPCKSTTKTHSLLTRSWNLSYAEDASPLVMIVDSSTISCQVMVKEESPGLHEKKPESTVVYETSDRKHHWPTIFRHVASHGVVNFVPSVVAKKERDRKKAGKKV
jgi:hypothetical protein